MPVTPPTIEGPNLFPGKYRGVSVARPGCRLDPDALRDHFLGIECYRRTRFVVVRDGDETALIRVTKESDEPLFSKVISVDVLAGPDECAFVHEPEADTAIPSALAQVARDRAPDVRAVVVQGRYEHVNFILGSRPVRIRVREVVPPSPAKLFDQAMRILAVTEDLPPIELVPELIRFEDLARRHPASHYILPCRGSGADITGAEVSYLDERPDLGDWQLIGCARSQQIHHWFYDKDVPTVDICPLRTANREDRGQDLLLTKCCLREEGVESGGGWVSVPWGSSLEQVREALFALVRQRESSWQPA